MDLGLQLNISAKLEQRLSPQMIQSLKLLQVTSQELELMVQQELEVNPILEIESEVEDVKEPEATETKETELDEIQEAKEEIDWDEYLNDGFDYGMQSMDSRPDPDEQYERPIVYSKNLEDYLIEQLEDRKLSAEITDLVEYLIYSLNADGLLIRESGEEIPTTSNRFYTEIESVINADKSLYEVSNDVREAFHVLQTFTPAGVGATSVQECLLLQARKEVFDSIFTVKILEESYGMLQKLQVSNLAKKYDTSTSEIQKALGDIARLNPKPGQAIGDGGSATVIPDVAVENVEGKLMVYLNDKSVPNLRISKAYSSILQKGSKLKGEEKQFVKQKLNSANWLMRSIDQRKSTILKVTQAIVEVQHDFFFKGPSFLKPLILQDIADKIEMHISTVNRVTNGKYVQTDMGIFELKKFFTSSVTQQDGSEVSAERTKGSIKDTIENEDPKKPLSDQKIVEALKIKGIEVARRTVAKYREQLNILPARMRKKF
ncbi:MAG: RNA polymerase factor sigma-54 [Fibrobacterales bacterium]